MSENVVVCLDSNSNGGAVPSGPPCRAICMKPSSPSSESIVRRRSETPSTIPAC